MSNTSNWSYQNTATVKPLISQDEYGEGVYGTEYTIACTWGANGKQLVAGAEQRASSGREYVVKNTVYTEDPRPKYLDMIKLNGHEEWEEIRDRQEFDMSPFGETPDYVLITG